LLLPTATANCKLRKLDTKELLKKVRKIEIKTRRLS